jgi:ABC-type nitrate/sulfonate/bicarbonate transport system substrate-binding protein
MLHDANIGCKTDRRQEMLGAGWTVGDPNGISIFKMNSTAKPRKRFYLSPREPAPHAASFIVFFIHVFSVISPAFAERSAEATKHLAQLQAQVPAKSIETINLAMPSFNVTGLPFYVAVDKGYYLAEGIDLRIVKVQGAHTVATLLTGDIQFAVIGTTAITARYSGAPLRVIASTLARPFQWLYARPEIEQLDQLKGTTVSTTLFGGASTFFLTKVLKENFRWKDPERELRWLSTPTPFMTLLNRSASAASLSGEEKQQADRSGMRMILDVGKYIQAAYGGTVVTESTLKNRQVLAERFLRTLLRGLWFIQDPGKKEETVRILAKWLKADRDYSQSIYEMAKDSWTKDGLATEKAMALSLEMSRTALKSARQELAPSDMYEFALMKKVNAQLESSGWRP